jgi:LemA protein
MSSIWIAIGAAAVLALWFALSFNRFVSQRQLLENSWSNVDTELRRRYDLIPNLVETVRGYAAHESSTLTEVIEARQTAELATGGAKAQTNAENVLVEGLRHLFAVSEAYPDLVASSNYLDLQRQLVTTEDRIQAARRLFNGNVRDYNRRVEAIPSRLVAAILRFEREAYFEVEPAVRVSGPPPVARHGESS